MTDAAPELAGAATLPQVAGAVLLAALTLYAVSGGADFGAGLWDLTARGPRQTPQRGLIERTLAPIWETNHVWLIFAVVVLFSAFPAAFAAVGVALYAPLSLALLGIVLRGAGFVFRQYGRGSPRDARRWGRVFGAASLLAPAALGSALAALAGGHIRVAPDGTVSSPTSAWLGAFPLAVALFVLVLFAWLAAVYLCVEADDRALREDFRVRALAAGLALGLLSVVVRVAAQAEAPAFARRLFAVTGLAGAMQAAVAVLALAGLAALWRRRFRLARALAVMQAGTVVVGWGWAQRPFLVAPDVTLRAAAAPPAALRVVLLGIAAGAIVLVPALLWMFRVLRRAPRA